jgi:mercuric ion transport protein
LSSPTPDLSPVAAFEPGEDRAAPQARSAYKMIFWGVAALAGAAVAFPYILPLFN